MWTIQIICNQSCGFTFSLMQNVKFKQTIWRDIKNDESILDERSCSFALLDHFSNIILTFFQVPFQVGFVPL